MENAGPAARHVMFLCRVLFGQTMDLDAVLSLYCKFQSRWSPGRGESPKEGCDSRSALESSASRFTTRRQGQSAWRTNVFPSKAIREVT